VVSVPNSVKLVSIQLIIVLFVLMDMPDHQVVIGFQSPNQLKLKMFQLDLPKSPTVMKDVNTVLPMEMNVYLVILIEKVPHLAHVLMDTMKLKKKFVNFVDTDVLNVQVQLITVMNVME